MKQETVMDRTLSILGRRNDGSVEWMMARELARWRALGKFNDVKAELGRANKRRTADSNMEVARANGSGPCLRCVGRMVVSPGETETTGFWARLRHVLD